MDGSATFTIVASRMTMNCAKQIRTRTIQGFVVARKLISDREADE